MQVKNQHEKLNNLSEEKSMILKAIAKTKKGQTVQELSTTFNRSYNSIYPKVIELFKENHISRFKGGSNGSYIYQINPFTTDLISWVLENKMGHSNDKNLFSQTDLLSTAEVNPTLENEQVFEQLKNLLNEVLSHHKQAGEKIQQILDLLNER